MPRLDGSYRETRERGNKATSDAADDLPPMRLHELPACYLSVDPGSIHCGVARWEVSRGAADPYSSVIDDQNSVTIVRLVEVYERSPRALEIELRELEADGIGLVIAEDFRLQKGRNAQGSRLVTPRVLGVIEYIARQQGVAYREQVPSIKPNVDAWVRGQVPPSHGGGVNVEDLASNAHKRDAVRHGLYPALRDKRDRAAVRLVLDEHDRGRGRPKPR